MSLAIDSGGRTIWIADAHRDDGKRFIVRADDILTAFLELESAIHQFAVMQCHNGQPAAATCLRCLFEVADVLVRLDHYRNEGSDPSNSDG